MRAEIFVKGKSYCDKDKERKAKKGKTKSSKKKILGLYFIIHPKNYHGGLGRGKDEEERKN